MKKKLYLLKTKALDKLKDDSMTGNYSSAGFDDFFEKEKDSLVDSGIEYDTAEFKNLKGTSKDEIHDSCIIYDALKDIPPSLACQGMTWAHLGHTDLLNFGIKRWLDNKSGEILERAKMIHFNDYSWNRLRDDFAASRPWWTAHIASKIAGNKRTENIRKVLEIFAHTTDTRSNSIERSTVFSDVHLARHLRDYLIKNKHIYQNEGKFRELMKNINFKSNGVFFEHLNHREFSKRFM